MLENRMRRGIGSSNPVYGNIPRDEAGEVVSTKNVVVKTFILLSIAIISGLFASYSLLVPVEIQSDSLIGASKVFSGVAIVLLIIGFIGTWISIKPIFAFMYAIGYGAILGIVSTAMEALFPGIVSTAVIATGTVFLVMLLLYVTRIIKVTEFLKSLIYSFMASFFVFIFGIFIISLFSSSFAEVVYGNGGISIGISAISIGLGAAMLLLDFDRIESFERDGVSNKYEWRLAFGLTVTIIWLYVEILKLLAKLASRD